MRIEIEFSNGLAPFVFELEDGKTFPLELLVEAKGSPHSRQKVLNTYVRALDYLFRGVANYASGDIVRVMVQKNWLGCVEKNRDSIRWKANIDPMFFVVYSITRGVLTENMYVADAIAVNKKSLDVRPLWLKELLDPYTKTGKTWWNNTVNAVAIATEYLKDYDLVYSSGKLDILDKKTKKVVKLDEVQDDEDYTILRLLMVILGKGIHQGVFFVDAGGFSDRSLKAFWEIAKWFYEDTFLFVYNCRPSCTLERVPVVFPHFAVGAHVPL